MNQRSPITTHVLDTSLGRPAAGVRVVLEALSRDGQPNSSKQLAEGTTDDDGRLTDLLAPGSLEAGNYRLTFATHDYFDRLSEPTFYPEVVIEFTVVAPEEHYHVPLLISPFGYSTYRGS